MENEVTVHCNGCSTEVDTICDNCSRCSECCTCVHCEGCESTVSSRCSRCRECSECCSCEHCSGCNRPRESTCSNCNCCESCCECSWCEHCESYVSSDRFCGNCDSCHSCCSCDSNDEGPRVKQGSGFHEARRNERKQNELARLAGIELEIDSVSDSYALTSWAKRTGAGLVADGSLPNSGVEIVMRPASGDALLSDIQSLGRALDNSGAAITDSCGFHVHVDARDYTQADLRRLILLYAACERTLFELVSRTRHSNDYCHPCGKTYVDLLATAKNGLVGKHWSKAWRKALNSSLYAACNRSIPENKNQKYHPSRYHAMNLHTFFYRRTIEFRMHESTVDARVIANWALVCAWIVDYALRHSEKRILALIAHCVTGEELLERILPVSVSAFVCSRLVVRRAARDARHTQANTVSRLSQIMSGPDTVTRAACALNGGN